MTPLTDFPKIQCPFERVEYAINKKDFEEFGRLYNLRKPFVYLVIDKIKEGYEWVFDDKYTICIEKLDGTNVKLETEDGRLYKLYNRKNMIDPLQIMKGKTHIIEAIFRAIQKGYINENGIQAGEVIGPKLQGNPYRLEHHIWYPFERAIESLKYKSFHKYDRTFDNWSSWFKDYLFSLFCMRNHIAKDIPAEGVVFYNLNRKAEGKPYMAKLRRDMYEWFYTDHIRILK